MRCVCECVIKNWYSFCPKCGKPVPALKGSGTVAKPSQIVIYPETLTTSKLEEKDIIRILGRPDASR